MRIEPAAESIVLTGRESRDRTLITCQYSSSRRRPRQTG